MQLRIAVLMRAARRIVEHIPVEGGTAPDNRSDQGRHV